MDQLLSPFNQVFDQIQALIDKYGRGNGYNKAAELVLIANSIINADGYPLHDVGASAYTLRKFRIGSQAEIAIAAHIARARAKDNAFFEYVAKGPTVRFKSMILKECPSKATDFSIPHSSGYGSAKTFWSQPKRLCIGTVFLPLSCSR